MKAMPEPADHAGALHEMNPTGRFSDRARDYVAFRPTYPAPIIDAVLDALGDPASLSAADVGAGTGISARLLAGRGVRVVAVEPNEPMALAADPHPLVRWTLATAEETGLPASSVDLVLCAQAFHWFRPIEALAEFRRILRLRGRLALLWNVRDDSHPGTRAYSDIIKDVAGREPAEMRELDVTLLPRGGFEPPSIVRVPHVQRLDLRGLVGRALSASYVPKEGPGRAKADAMLRDAFARHAQSDGMFELRYWSTAYLSSPSKA